MVPWLPVLYIRSFFPVTSSVASLFSPNIPTNAQCRPNDRLPIQESVIFHPRPLLSVLCFLFFSFLSQYSVLVQCQCTRYTGKSRWGWIPATHTVSTEYNEAYCSRIATGVECESICNSHSHRKRQNGRRGTEHCMTFAVVRPVAHVAGYLWMLSFLRLHAHS
jgi:hypothetical protein